MMVAGSVLVVLFAMPGSIASGVPDDNRSELLKGAGVGAWRYGPNGAAFALTERVGITLLGGLRALGLWGRFSL